MARKTLFKNIVIEVKTLHIKERLNSTQKEKKKRLEAFKCWVKLSGKVLQNVRREPWLMRLCHLYLPVVPYQLCSHPLTETGRQGINLP